MILIVVRTLQNHFSYWAYRIHFFAKVGNTQSVLLWCVSVRKNCGCSENILDIVIFIECKKTSLPLTRQFHPSAGSKDEMFASCICRLTMQHMCFLGFGVKRLFSIGITFSHIKIGYPPLLLISSFYQSSSYPKTILFMSKFLRFLNSQNV